MSCGDGGRQSMDDALVSILASGAITEATARTTCSIPADYRRVRMRNQRERVGMTVR